MVTYQPRQFKNISLRALISTLWELLRCAFQLTIPLLELRISAISRGCKSTLRLLLHPSTHNGPYKVSPGADQ